MARGLGEMQKNERMLTNYKIIGALYVQPYTYQQLWIATKIQRNTLKRRLDQLVNDRIIIKHRYNFRKYSEKYYSRRDFYLLNWANKQSREMVDCVFDSKRVEDSVSFILDPSISRTRTSYEINSIHVKSGRKKYPLIGRRTTTLRRPYNELVYDPYYYGEHSVAKPIFCSNSLSVLLLSIIGANVSCTDLFEHLPLLPL
jgi:hypothetical protein